MTKAASAETEATPTKITKPNGPARHQRSQSSRLAGDDAHRPRQFQEGRTHHCGESIGKLMQTIGRRYVQYINHSYHRTASLWEGRFKSSVVQAEDYLLTCMRYIELNPVRANMVNDPAQYRWSSYRHNGLGQADERITPHPLYLGLGKNEGERLSAYRALFRCELDGEALTDIRLALSQNQSLGNERFSEIMCAAAGVRRAQRKLGITPLSDSVSRRWANTWQVASVWSIGFSTRLIRFKVVLLIIGAYTVINPKAGSRQAGSGEVFTISIGGTRAFDGAPKLATNSPALPHFKRQYAPESTSIPTGSATSLPPWKPQSPPGETTR